MTPDNDFLSRALTLIDNGYRIIPVRAGEKRPGVEKWQDLHATPAMAKRWASGGFATGNIGIITAQNPALDLDIYDADMAEKMEAWCLAEFGATPVRVGRAPKRLLMYCASADKFAKMFTTFADTRGVKHKIEVLADGQQFVAYGIHPDTKRPFEWTSAETPLNTPADFMPELTAEMARAMLAQYAAFATSAGWTQVGSSEGRTMVVAGEDDSSLLTHKPTLKLTMGEILHALEYTDDADQYDRWVMVGMALHHQSRGHLKGLELWQDWSSTAHNYDGDACESKWQSFNENSGRHTPVTFASVLKIAHEREKAEKGEEFTRALNVLRTATNPEEIFGPIAKQLAESITSDFQVDIVAKKMQDRVFELTEVKPRIDVVRKALAKSKGELTDRNARPEWCDGWVYLKNGDTFYNLDTKTELTDRGFNAVHDRLVLTDEDRMLGVANPSSRASSLALNIHQIPTVDHTVYMPGADKIIEINGKTCANTFDENSVPAAKAPETDEEFKALAAVQNHFKVIFPDRLDHDLVLDYLSYSVQFPAEKIVWGIVMQGAEGAGKTFISRMMSRVMGPSNVGPVSATELQDKYTGWAEGRKLIFIEEIRLHGSNRYEVLDKLKPYVSNEDVTIRKMFGDSYDIPNCANYILFTNYWDGMPFSRMDRRYLVVATWFQTKDQIAEWTLKYPRYFGELFDAVRDHSDVLRHWLLNRTLCDEFQPKRPAIDTHAKNRMREESDSSDEADTLSDVLESSTDPEISARLLNADKLKLLLENAGALVPYGRAFNTMMTKAGFFSVGRFRIDPTKLPVRFYTKQPHLFAQGEELTTIRTIQNETLLLTHDMPDMDDPFA